MYSFQQNFEFYNLLMMSTYNKAASFIHFKHIHLIKQEWKVCGTNSTSSPSIIVGEGAVYRAKPDDSK